MNQHIPKYFYRSCFSYFTKLKMKVDIDQLAKEVHQQKIIINSSSSKNIDEFLKKYQKMKSINQDYELMQQTHKDYVSLAHLQMSRTLDMEKTSKRIGQVHKSQRNNLDNMNKSTKSLQLLKNELYELFFQLENKKYDLKSNEMTKLKEYLNHNNQNVQQTEHQEIINKELPQLIQSGEMIIDIQDRMRTLRPNNSLLLKQLEDIKSLVYEAFKQKGYFSFDHPINNLQRCQFPINTLFQSEYQFVEINPEEKEYLCLNSSIPGLLELTQSRININERFKIITITPIINSQLNGLSDIKIELISETDTQNVEEDIINILSTCQEIFSKILNQQKYKIDIQKDDTKSHLTLNIQDGNLMTFRSYGNYISKRMNLKIKHFVGQEVFEEVSCLNVMEIPSLYNLLLYKNYHNSN